MKTKLLYIFIFIFFSNFLFAGGISRLSEPKIYISNVIDIPELDKYYYTGLTYSYINIKNNMNTPNISTYTLTLLAGYKFHPFLSIETRYTTSLTDSNIIYKDVSNIALYIKPQYALNEITLYSLFGIGRIYMDNSSVHANTSFQWGFGAMFSETEDIDFFIDYTNVFNNTSFDDVTLKDVSANTISLGINYNF